MPQHTERTQKPTQSHALQEDENMQGTKSSANYWEFSRAFEISQPHTCPSSRAQAEVDEAQVKPGKCGHSQRVTW